MPFALLRERESCFLLYFWCDDIEWMETSKLSGSVVTPSDVCTVALSNIVQFVICTGAELTQDTSRIIDQMETTMQAHRTKLTSKDS